jgi:F0F1-type ATP synthase delta subunit
MKTDALNNSKHVLETLSLDDEEKRKVIEDFLKSEQDVESNFIEYFKEELDRNILRKESPEGVEIVVKHYINELLGANVIFDENKQILLDHNYIGKDSSEYAPPHFKDIIEISDIEKFIIITYYIFNCHFYDIQESCIKNQIDFFELCRKVHFRWDMISTGITQGFKETEDLLRIKNESPVLKSLYTGPKQPTKPSIALFCKIVSNSKLDQQGMDSVEKFCQRICSKYSLGYTDKVRQQFQKSPSVSNIKQIKDLIFPNIDEPTRIVLSNHLDSIT